MPTQIEQARIFSELHVSGKPIILVNIWDAGSAQAVASAGALAIATGSAPVAMANGFSDGEVLPLELALENVIRIINAVNLPVTMDLEGGYGADPAVVSATVSRAMAAGIVGFNFEDQIVGGNGLYDLQEQTTRIAAARSACDASGVSGFINARTDIFLKAKPEEHTESMLAEAIDRANAYKQSGASGFFAPGLADEVFIGKLCESVSLPVNILGFAHVPLKDRLSELGVARISYGPLPYRQAMKHVEQEALAAFT